jgi:hypothetical protein
VLGQSEAVLIAEMQNGQKAECWADLAFFVDKSGVNRSETAQFFIEDVSFEFALDRSNGSCPICSAYGSFQVDYLC